MSTKDDGGPAFPRQLPKVEVSPSRALELINEHAGMSLRDYFAAKAMQARLDYAVIPADMAQERMARLARDAYLMADAMLEARK